MRNTKRNAVLLGVGLLGAGIMGIAQPTLAQSRADVREERRDVREAREKVREQRRDVRQAATARARPEGRLGKRQGNGAGTCGRPTQRANVAKSRPLWQGSSRGCSNSRRSCSAN